jgi:dipeptidyl aminopeptidase/acylaminoacyl peptidase
MQGTANCAVPSSQSEVIVDTIRKHDGDVKYVLFEGERHGFRRAASVHRALDEELAFHKRLGP